ncbi:MAG TPA: zinc-binding dehydrogenase [Pseudonocardia sp.]|nr:zinc-binding dehydrogenase [Pseudonocardia sp.]
MRAAGAGYPDVMMAAGQFPLLGAPPFGLGEEAAGEVVAVPEGSRFAVGDQVTGIAAFLDGWGGYAEYTYLREESTMRIPPGMTDTQAAGFPIAFRTAYAALVHRVPVSRGQRLAVLGAAGSSGVAALQLGRARGAEVIALAGSPEKTNFCLRLGADHAIDYRTENVADRLAEITGGAGVDVVFDPVGGDTAAEAVRAIARNGRVALVGLASGRPLALDQMDLLLRNYTVSGVLATPLADPAAEAAVWTELVELAATGTITTPVGTVYDFEDVPLMVAEQATPGPGKTVVEVSGQAREG